MALSREVNVPGSIVFRWYDRARADDMVSTWTVEQLLARLEAENAGKIEQPLGRPGVATSDSLRQLLEEWQRQGYTGERISQVPAERASDKLLRYELICDACTQAEWRAKEAFFLRHVNGLRGGMSESSSGLTLLESAELEQRYAASREGRFRWQEWPALNEALERLTWERWQETFRASYELDKPTRRAGVERVLRENYAAFEELQQRLAEGEQQGWALTIYDANDERLPFPPPPMLMDAVRQTEAEVAEARREAEATLARRRRFQRVVVPIVLIAVFLLLSFIFTQSILGGVVGTGLILLIIAIVIFLTIRQPGGNRTSHDHH
jgi:hypothetical protein